METPQGTAYKTRRWHNSVMLAWRSFTQSGNSPRWTAEGGVCQQGAVLSSETPGSVRLSAAFSLTQRNQQYCCSSSNNTQQNTDHCKTATTHSRTQTTSLWTAATTQQLKHTEHLSLCEATTHSGNNKQQQRHTADHSVQQLQHTAQCSTISVFLTTLSLKLPAIFFLFHV